MQNSDTRVVGGLVFTSGQIARDPIKKGMVCGDVSLQIQQTLRNLDTVLKAAGSSLKNVIKLTIYLRSIENLSVIDEMYETYFSAPFPARTTVEVSRLAMGALIEIEAIAVTDEAILAETYRNRAPGEGTSL